MRHYKIDLTYWKNTDYEQSQTKLTNDLRLLHKDKYEQDELIILDHTVDYYVGKSKLGLILRNVQTIIKNLF